MKKLFATLILSLSLTACGDGQNAGKGRPAPTVGVYTIKSEAIPLASMLPGRTRAYRVSEIRPQVNGIVLTRSFIEGSMVAEGEELYQINPDIYKANYDKAKARMDNLDRSVKRKESLKKQASISDQDYEDTLYSLAQAKADVELARLNLEYSKVAAPFSGHIGKSNITEGALVTSGQAQAMAVINQVDPILVDLTPSINHLLAVDKNFQTEEDKPAFLQDSEVWLTLEDGSRYPLAGKMKFIDNEVDTGTGTVTMRAEFPNPKGTLLPGMYVRALVQEGVIPQGIVVPQQALVRDMKGNPQVWVVTEDNSVQLKPIATNRTLGNTWLVTGGLKAGDRVVTEGLQRLANDMPVTPEEAKNVTIKLDYEQQS